MDNLRDHESGSALASVIRAEHRQRLAVVYIRQSTADQVRENTGSTAAQRDLREVAKRLGWPESRIRVIESDLGQSGTSSFGRKGYLQLLGLMDQHKVGMVLVQDLSRLGRKRSETASFLELAEERGTLIYTNGAVHDPASGDLASTLGLEIAGSFGNYDNRLRVRRMQEAKLAKARRGQAVSPPPIGYARTPDGAWIKDPDRAVQEAVGRVFDLYPKLGSLGKVVAYFREHGLEFPRRFHGQVRWGPIDPPFLHSILRNPAYCGDYVFGRRKTKRRSEASGVVVKWRSADEWIVQHDHHEAYLPREAWERIRDSLASRRPTLRPLIGKGDALLQGLLRCGVDDCNRWMKTQYWGRDGMVRTATYTCLRQNGWGDTTHKVTVPARHIDHIVVEHVLSALTAVDDETARDVIERSQLEQETLQRAQHRRLLDAEEDLQRIRQLALNLPPELQHGRLDLMAQYDAASQRHLELKTHLATKTTSSLAVTTADTGDLVELTRNIRQLWQAPQRTNEERKRLLQTVVSEVILQRANRETADLEIVWKGGLRQVLTVRRPRGVDAYVATETGAGKTAQQIANELNAAGAITATGRPLSANVVAQKQGRLGIRLKQERVLAWEIIRQALLEDRPRPDILRELRERAPRLGPWDPQRLSEAIRRLRRAGSGIEPLPSLLPADERRQQVLTLIEAELVAGKSWTRIAAMLNETGLRPPRAKTFTPVQVRLLYLRARGLRPSGIPSPQREKPKPEA